MKSSMWHLQKNVTNNLHLGSSESPSHSITRLFDATLVGNVFDIVEHRGLSRQSKQPVQRARKSPASLWKYEQRPLQYSFGLFHEQLAESIYAFFMNHNGKMGPIKPKLNTV